jgi:ATP-dependent Clp protease ATP-binding subunit ClpC
MDFNKLTDRARKAIQRAKKEAERLNHDYVGTEHLLLGILKDPSAVASTVLKELGIDYEKARIQIEKMSKPGGGVAQLGDIPLTPRTKSVLENALQEARKMKHSYIGSEHILLALLAEPEGLAAQAIVAMGLPLEKARQELLVFLGPENNASQPPSKPGKDDDDDEPQTKRSSATPALDTFGRDLTKLAKAGRLDPLVGRADELKRVETILARRTKNNPVLLGEAGVGKTAIVEGLAQRISDGKVPDILSGKRLVALDLAAMVAGTKYRGQFEERIKAVLHEIAATKNIIIFIDELHTLVGAGGAEGALDGANILKPALSRGELQCIGATTFDEYKKTVEKDKALERRFQTVQVDEPTVAQTVEILRGLRKYYERHHMVKIEDEAIQEAARLSQRYITGRALPDKAIDVLDEAGARLRIDKGSLPPEVETLEKLLSTFAKDKEEAVKKEEFELAADIVAKEDEIKATLAKVKEAATKPGRVLGIIGPQAVREVISLMTKIPLEQMTEAERSRLLQMEKEINKTVVGQEDAVTTIARAVRRSRAGLKDPKRPIASFLFLGPTGCGKTLLAKALANFLFGSPEALVQIDMSEYMEKHSVARLIGAPPGYIGYEEGGQLTEKVKRKQYCVILFDEIEKAHEEAFNLLLQIMEEGHLTDGLNRTVDFRNTIILMTSNVGANLLQAQGIGFGHRSGDTSDDVKHRIKEQVDQMFRPEFLNRLDDMIFFRKLSREDMLKIVDLEVSHVAARLKEQEISISVGKEAKEFLVEKGFDPKFGARPLRRAVEHYVEDAVADEIIGEKIPNGCEVEVGVSATGDKLTFAVKAGKKKRKAKPKDPGEGKEECTNLIPEVG